MIFGKFLHATMLLDVTHRHVTFTNVIDKLYLQLNDLKQWKSDEWKHFKPCDVFRYPDGQDAMKIAIDQEDNESLKYFLRIIKVF